MQISTAHTGLRSFVSAANPGKAESGKKNSGREAGKGEEKKKKKQHTHTVESGKEKEVWDSVGWIGEDLVL